MTEETPVARRWLPYGASSRSEAWMPEVWQPIDTAPKDGKPFLAFARGADGLEYWGVALWAEDLSRWWWQFVAVRPTHWMPLPGAPKK